MGMSWMEVHALGSEEGRFLRACRGLPVDRVPVWFMRQAGRYQPEYREIRKGRSLLEITLDPALCAEVTVLPVRQLGVDAAILFSDIMVPLGPVGIDYTLEEHVGPVIAKPVRDAAAIREIGTLEPRRQLPHVLETIERTRTLLGETPLIGFAGAPFTLASYVVEGRPSRHHLATKRFMHAEPAAFRDLLERLGDVVIAHLRAQVEAGAQAIQLFDSWVGSLSPADFEEHVLPVSSRIFAALADLGVPRIYFGVETGELLGLMRRAGADVVGVDWRVPLRGASARVGQGAALQGNLDPALLLAPWAAVERAARACLEDGTRHEGGYIFNLGHGVLPETSPEQLRRLTEFVHAFPVPAQASPSPTERR
jgi:uroporphyrinogen decarboxylase